VTPPRPDRPPRKQTDRHTDAAPGTAGDPTRFDAAYYRTFYGRSPVHTRRDIAHLAQGVVALAAWWKLPIRTVLDIGAGPGYWRDWFAEHRPRVRYRSTDISDYACRRYGHEHLDVSQWRPERANDLVVCQGVLHYLDARRADAAITNLIAATSGLLYLEAPTSEDRDDVLDTDTSDLHAVWRPARWYRQRLEVGFIQAGAGLWVRRGAVHLYALEGVGPRR
jgi:hypothetical protein